jgi:FAS-associated factor 2
MASSTVDLGSLTDEQQAALQQYTAVTDQEIEAAVPLLQRSQWNLQVCLLAMQFTLYDRLSDWKNR